MGDRAFTGGIPNGYEAQIVPLLMEPYADDLGERVAKYEPQEIIELAAGTGVLTRALATRMPNARILATDLNAPMLDRAAKSLHGNTRVRFETHDACMLNCPDASADIVTSQFGVMFFPDRVEAFRHAKRALREHGRLVFNTWDSIYKNPACSAMAKAYKAATGQECFLERAPFSYCDQSVIENELHACGFTDVKIVRVEKATTVHSPAAFIDAFANGSPLGEDFNLPGMGRGAAVREAVYEGLVAAVGDGSFENHMSALVIEAQ